MRAHAASLFDQSSEQSRSSAFLTATGRPISQGLSRMDAAASAAAGGRGGGDGETNASEAAAKSVAVASELFSSLDAVPVVASGSLHQLFSPAQMQVREQRWVLKQCIQAS